MEKTKKKLAFKTCNKQFTGFFSSAISAISSVTKGKLPLSTISYPLSTIGYPYRQLVTIFNFKRVYLPNLESTCNCFKACQINNLQQKQATYIYKKLPLSTIGYPFSTIGYPYQQSVTLLSTISYLLSTISYPWYSENSIVATKTDIILKLLKLKEKLVTNKWRFL